MNPMSLASVMIIIGGTLLGSALGLFAYGADMYISTGIGCGLGACMALSEFSPVFD